MSNLPKWLVSDPRPSADTHVTYADALRCGYIAIGTYIYDEYGESWRITGVQQHANGGVVFVTARNPILGGGAFKPDMISYVEIPQENGDK